MSHSLPEPHLEAEAEALLDDIFARLEEPLPPRCLPPASQPLALVRPIPEPGALVVLACNPAPLVPVTPRPYNPETILTAAFVDTPAAPPTPWWLWLGLGTLVMVATWQGRHQWHAAQTPVPSEPTHQEFITYLERALTQIPELTTAPAPPAKAGTQPPGLASLPPPPPVTVLPIPQAPVITAPVAFPASPTAPAPVAPKPVPRSTPTLIGLLQMGAGSVAMFQIGEATQQVSVGSQVGQSGWQVKEVREQGVVISRAGQNRTLIVGQTISD
ncbi:hypothetical protein GlitD10_0790 [Gloeomargarita lithophora Alchichica-D10]|uniref:Uncharacterized protein n=1 Tax=Gloeomargarita lithophora Alchichica-D10 TaxID=1188229 RepID=A0A1J0AAZ0_9CYAN|nr:hypothetical protein [Gloeomargarita lithophora]APB33104.1 hypothetical protein GlitD10_0790 [Gloeomargarita lithophora Alchichica-D10]